MNLTRLKKFYYLKFLRIKGDPKSIAWGSFIGAFIGTLPVMPFHTIGIIAICFITRTSAMAGLFASLLISNPFTYIPIYYLSLVIGNFLTPYTVNWAKIHAILDIIIHGQFKASVQTLASQGSEIIIVMLTGGFVLAVPTALLWYIFTLRLFIKFREQRRQRHILRERKKKK
jgi:uncharacterized protein